MQPTHSKDETFIRLVVMILFAFILNVSISVVVIIGVIQWFIRLFRDDEIVRLKEFSSSLNEFNYQIGQFLTLNVEQKPFPFSDWPAAELNSSEEVVVSEPKETNSKDAEPSKEEKQESNLKKQQESDLSHDASIIDQDLTDDEQLDSMKGSDS